MAIPLGFRPERADKYAHLPVALKAVWPYGKLIPVGADSNLAHF